MNLHANILNGLKPETAVFYRQAMQALKRAEVPFLIGGAYALAIYAGVVRHTKDFDVFVRPEDSGRTLEVLAEARCPTELTFSHWLGKAFRGDDFIDIIFSSGNGVARVDDEWFAHAPAGDVLGEPVLLCPAEETIWSKGYLMERERFDGADIAHLLRARGRDLDWPRLLWRYGADSRVLLSHLVLFGFVYPGEQSQIPLAVMQELIQRLERDLAQDPPPQRLCQGTLLSREQYIADIEQLGYADARRQPTGAMTRTQIARWTEAIGRGK